MRIHAIRWGSVPLLIGYITTVGVRFYPNKGGGNHDKNHLPSGYLTVCHGKSPFVIGKPAINGPFSMAMLNSQRV